jgi:hypothetical protein
LNGMAAASPQSASHRAVGAPRVAKREHDRVALPHPDVFECRRIQTGAREQDCRGSPHRPGLRCVRRRAHLRLALPHASCGVRGRQGPRARRAHSASGRGEQGGKRAARERGAGRPPERGHEPVGKAGERREQRQRRRRIHERLADAGRAIGILPRHGAARRANEDGQVVGQEGRGNEEREEAGGRIPGHRDAGDVPERAAQAVGHVVDSGALSLLAHPPAVPCRWVRCRRRCVIRRDPGG